MSHDDDGNEEYTLEELEQMFNEATCEDTEAKFNPLMLRNEDEPDDSLTPFLRHMVTCIDCRSRFCHYVAEQVDKEIANGKLPAMCARVLVSFPLMYRPGCLEIKEIAEKFWWAKNHLHHCEKCKICWMNYFFNNEED